nr:type II toxin-antitoxin system Phd/YefM family antitoxin [uncultured Ligilactobacillus sp.]
MRKVIATSSNEFRKNFKKYSDDVVDYQDAVIVTRPKNKNIVIISEDEYNSLRETAYLLENKENREFLRESMSQLKEGDVKVLTPDDWENLKNEE